MLHYGDVVVIIAGISAVSCLWWDRQAWLWNCCWFSFAQKFINLVGESRGPLHGHRVGTLINFVGESRGLHHQDHVVIQLGVITDVDED